MLFREGRCCVPKRGVRERSRDRRIAARWAPRQRQRPNGVKPAVSVDRGSLAVAHGRRSGGVRFDPALHQAGFGFCGVVAFQALVRLDTGGPFAAIKVGPETVLVIGADLADHDKSRAHPDGVQILDLGYSRRLERAFL